MAHTYVDSLELTCSLCENSFSTDVYKIVDINERPDLLVKIRNRTIHNIPCPNCAHDEQVNVSILVIRPIEDEEPILLYSPAEGISKQSGPNSR